MITGKKFKPLPSDVEVYKRTSGGRDIYTKYLGKVPHRGVMKRPWGEDNHPSWGVWQAPDGIWMWKDQARDEAGTPIHFVQRLFNLGFREAIEKIATDFDIESFDVRSVTSVLEKKEIKPASYVHITAKIKKFGLRHHAFWNAVDVTEDWCKKFDCYAVKELAINHKKVKIGEEEIVFVYLASDINKVKIYFPDREGAARFRTNVPFHYLWNCNKITKPCNRLVVHKSMKDLITFAQLHPHNVATQNESVSVFDDATVNTINELSTDVWLFYGSDPDGVDKAEAIQKKFKWSNIETPLALFPEVNDVYSFVKKFGIKKLEHYCKSKNLL